MQPCERVTRKLSLSIGASSFLRAWIERGAPIADPRNDLAGGDRTDHRCIITSEKFACSPGFRPQKSSPPPGERAGAGAPRAMALAAAQSQPRCSLDNRSPCGRYAGVLCCAAFRSPHECAARLTTGTDGVRVPCIWSEEKNLCIDDDACHPAPLSPPLRQPPAPPSPPPPSLPCRAMGSTRKPGPATQLQLAPLPGSCEFAVASWLPLQDAAGCNGALQQVEVRPAVAGDWTQAVVETVNATAVLVLGLEVGLGLLYRFRLRSRWREHWIAGESTGVRFADGSSPLAAPRVSATSSASVLLNWSRGLGCDEGTHWSVQVARAGSFPARSGLLPAPAQWHTLGNTSATVVAYPLVCTGGCVFRVRLLTYPEIGFGDASERVLTPALPSVAPNAVRTLLTLRAEPTAARNADLASWQVRFAHALEKRLRVPRVTVVEVQRLLGPERWIAVDLLSDR